MGDDNKGDLTRIEDLDAFVHDESDDDSSLDFDQLSNEKTDPNYQLPTEFLNAGDEESGGQNETEDIDNFDNFDSFESDDNSFDDGLDENLSDEGDDSFETSFDSPTDDEGSNDDGSFDDDNQSFENSDDSFLSEESSNAEEMNDDFAQDFSGDDSEIESDFNNADDSFSQDSEASFEEDDNDFNQENDFNDNSENEDDSFLASEELSADDTEDSSFESESSEDFEEIQQGSFETPSNDDTELEDKTIAPPSVASAPPQAVTAKPMENPVKKLKAQFATILSQSEVASSAYQVPYFHIIIKHIPEDITNQQVWEVLLNNQAFTQTEEKTILSKLASQTLLVPKINEYQAVMIITELQSLGVSVSCHEGNFDQALNEEVKGEAESSFVIHKWKPASQKIELSDIQVSSSSQIDGHHVVKSFRPTEYLLKVPKKTLEENLVLAQVISNYLPNESEYINKIVIQSNQESLTHSPVKISEFKWNFLQTQEEQTEASKKSLTWDKIIEYFTDKMKKQCLKSGGNALVDFKIALQDVTEHQTIEALTLKASGNIVWINPNP